MTTGPAEHIGSVTAALAELEAEAARIDRLGRQLARAFRRGHRLLAVGTGPGATQARHLVSELAGRYCANRPPLLAIALGCDVAPSSSDCEQATAELLSGQVLAHGRPGDVIVALSSVHSSPGVIAATDAALRMGMRTVGLTGRLPNALACLCCDVIAADSDTPATVEAVHQVALHVLCGGIDAELAPSAGGVALSPADIVGSIHRARLVDQQAG